MNNLLELINAADKGAISETNFQRIDTSLAFMLVPSLDLTGNPTALAGPPVAGNFAQGMLWVDGLLAIWRCTEGGAPGNWIQQTPAIIEAYPAIAVPVAYLIQIPAQGWSSFYWNGNQWLPVFSRNPGADTTKETADSTTITADTL
jgi:hypothetical protein